MTRFIFPLHALTLLRIKRTLNFVIVPRRQQYLSTNDCSEILDRCITFFLYNRRNYRPIASVKATTELLIINYEFSLFTNITNITSTENEMTIINFHRLPTLRYPDVGRACSRREEIQPKALYDLPMEENEELLNDETSWLETIQLLRQRIENGD
jgi:hypothetical protein